MALFDWKDSRLGEKETKILEAAMDEFIAEGWNGARMQSIADRAGMKKSLVHYYFRSKEKLYRETVWRVMEYFFNTVLGHTEGKENFEDFLRSFINSVVDATGLNPRIPLFLMQELSRGGEVVCSILHEILSLQEIPVTTVMRLHISRAIEKGEIRPVDPVQFILSLLGACLYFAMAEPIIREIGKREGFLDQFDRQAFLEQRKEAVFNQFYYGIGGKRSE